MQTEAETARRLRDNAEKARLLREANEGRGYAAVIVGSGESVHAAISMTQGHGGYQHPRPLCQRSSTRHYAGFANDSATREVTCKRCQGALLKRNLLTPVTTNSNTPKDTAMTSTASTATETVTAATPVETVQAVAKATGLQGLAVEPRQGGKRHVITITDDAGTRVLAYVDPLKRNTDIRVLVQNYGAESGATVPTVAKAAALVKKSERVKAKAAKAKAAPAAKAAAKPAAKKAPAKAKAPAAKAPAKGAAAPSVKLPAPSAA